MTTNNKYKQIMQQHKNIKSVIADHGWDRAEFWHATWSYDNMATFFSSI